MAEVISLAMDALDCVGLDSKEKPSTDDPQSSPPLSLSCQRDKEQRERRDDDPDVGVRERDRDYYDRNRSPGKDRDRDYKRRSSISPSPGQHRDRRYPSPYKRSRRNDVYDGRRGSPRGAPGTVDRKFGFDYGGGHERDMGSRFGHTDERPFGRYIGRASGYQDWSLARAGFGGEAASPSISSEGLMSYKQFIQGLEDDISPAEAERRYQEYKSEYISTQKKLFFESHKDEDWLRDRYHPTNLLSVIERRNEVARKVAKDFLLEIQNGSLDLGPGVNAGANKSGLMSDHSDEEAETGGKRRRHGRPAAKGADSFSAAPKAHPFSSDPRRIQLDVGRAQSLVQKLDSEKGIVENILHGSENDQINKDKSQGPVIIVRGLTSVKGLEGVELLDTFVTYLWRVHGLDYYGMREKSEAKGFRYVRSEAKDLDKTDAAAEWANKLDSHWHERLAGRDPLEVMTAKEKIDASAVESMDPFVRKIRDEKYGWKYGCGAKGCTKLFHAAEFVHKHLKLKHADLVMELTSKVREELYFHNYMTDADAPGGTPVMQQPTQVKSQRRKLGIESRLRDERGLRREREHRASDDLKSNGGGDRGSNDEQMCDAFGGQGMHPPVFPSDIPTPPVLMPVPGAGPLGPFVPAPPEVAMQMFREQGGPTSFDGAGRNARPGAPIGGRPVLLSPAYRQDPRRIRNYQDLDAMEDEVTVVDYRSL